MKKKLCEIGEIIAGGTPSTKINEYWNGKISWITPKDLSNYKERFISKGERSITEEGLKNSSAVLMPKNSILFTSRAPIGYVAIAKNELCTNQGFKSFVCDEKKCYYKYMYYWFLNNVETIRSKANGSTFQEVSGAVMKNIEIELPDMKTQINIGNLLDIIDRKIELNNRINNNLYEIINQMYNNLFTDIAQWKEIYLKDLVNILSGKRPKEKLENGRYPIIGASGKMGYTSEYNLDKDIIITGRVGTLGVVKRYYKKMWASDNTLIIETKYKNYVENYLKTLDYNSLNRGSTQPLLTQTDLKSQKVLFNEELINGFELKSEKFVNKIRNNEEENETLIQLRDTLLPKLMNGEINLDNIEI